jgi:hypothetical protein
VIAGAVILIAASGVGIGIDRPPGVEALGVASNPSWWPLGYGISGVIPGDHFGASVDINPKFFRRHRFGTGVDLRLNR